MRNLIITTLLSLDGVMQAPGAPEEDRSGGFAHGGWMVPYADEDLGRLVTAWIEQAGAFLLGRGAFSVDEQTSTERQFKGEFRPA